MSPDSGGDADAGGLPESFWAWRSGEMRITLRAMPTFSMPVMIAAEGSISHFFIPCTAERGKAWWLLCQASPNEGRDSQKTLVE